MGFWLNPELIIPVAWLVVVVVIVVVAVLVTDTVDVGSVLGVVDTRVSHSPPSAPLLAPSNVSAAGV